MISSPNRYNVIEHVPYDVWRHITSFLPPAEVEQLYGLDRSLLSIAMDERYKAASFGPLSQKQTMKCLARLVFVSNLTILLLTVLTGWNIQGT